jgi:hypothetical protein
MPGSGAAFTLEIGTIGLSFIGKAAFSDHRTLQALQRPMLKDIIIESAELELSAAFIVLRISSLRRLGCALEYHITAGIAFEDWKGAQPKNWKCRSFGDSPCI